MNLPVTPASPEKEELYKRWERGGWHFTDKERGPDGKTRLWGIESVEDVTALLFIVSQSREVKETPKYAGIPGNGNVGQCFWMGDDKYMDFLRALRHYHPDELRTAVTGLLAGLSDPTSPLSFQEKNDLFFYLSICPGYGVDMGRPFIDDMLRYAATMDPGTAGPDRAAHRAACTGMLLCLANTHIGRVMAAKESKNPDPALLEAYADLPAKAVDYALALADTLADDDERLPDTVWYILNAHASDRQISARAETLTTAYTHRLKAEWDNAMLKHTKDYEREKEYQKKGCGRENLKKPYDEFVSRESWYLSLCLGSTTGEERAQRTAEWMPLHEAWGIDRGYSRAVPGGSANIPPVDLEKACPQIVTLRRDALRARDL